jgi:hypothetical protein
MDLLVNLCVLAATLFAYGYLCYVIARPERF